MCRQISLMAVYLPRPNIGSAQAADYELAVVRARSGAASAEQRLAREQAEASGASGFD